MRLPSFENQQFHFKAQCFHFVFFFSMVRNTFLHEVRNVRRNDPDAEIIRAKMSESDTSCMFSN